MLIARDSARFSATKSAASLDGQLRRIAARFARPLAYKARLQLLTSFGPFLAACAAMYLVLPFSLPLAVALALPTGALLVRVFIVQHDCGHGSFFASRRANAWVGRLCSLLTCAPYGNWSRHHGVHHALSSNLDRPSSDTDMYSTCLTVRSYQALSPRDRFFYRLTRHPLIANFLLPPVVFLLVYRFPLGTPRQWWRERLSVQCTNAALVALFGGLVFLLGWRQVLLVQLPIMVVASILGVGLFSLQHRFATARWMDKNSWTFVDAALHGSSWLSLPAVLQWLTGNIGFHHVHHLNPRVPNYRLAPAHTAVQALVAVPAVLLGDVLGAFRLTLWDEAAGRMVAFSDVVAA
jgi:omega-6 fatty acid desaturase (delta-12 desaturase)